MLLSIPQTRQDQSHCKSAADSIVRRDGTSVLFHNPFGDRQSETGTAIVGREVGVEDPAQFGCGNAGASVGHTEAGLTVLSFDTKLHLALGPVGSNGVLEQVS